MWPQLLTAAPSTPALRELELLLPWASCSTFIWSLRMCVNITTSFQKTVQFLAVAVSAYFKPQITLLLSFGLIPACSLMFKCFLKATYCIFFILNRTWVNADNEVRKKWSQWFKGPVTLESMMLMRADIHPLRGLPRHVLQPHLPAVQAFGLWEKANQKKGGLKWSLSALLQTEDDLKGCTKAQINWDYFEQLL